MSKWPTIDEMLTSPIEVNRQDSFFKTINYPKFMRRKAILPETYEKKQSKVQPSRLRHIQKKNTPKESPSHRAFTAYGRVFERVKSIFEKNLVLKGLNSYDEALVSQDTFQNLSPNQNNSRGDYHISSCPKNLTVDCISPSKKKFFNKSHEKIGHKIKPKIDLELEKITRSNVLVLLNKNSKKCLECKKIKCECLIIDNELPENFYENLQKGRELIERQKSSQKRRVIIVSRPETRKKSNTRKLSGSFFNFHTLAPKKDPNLIEGKPAILHKHLRLNSA